MKIFDTLAALKAASLLQDEFVKIRGLNTPYDDEGRDFYILTPAQYGGVPDEVDDVTIANGNIAKLDAASTIELVRPAAILFAASLVDQNPAGTDTPLQISFGPAVNSPSDPVSVDANGTITVHESGTYEFLVFLAMSRSTSVGDARLFFRMTVNGAQVGNPAGAVLDDDDMTIPNQLTYIAPLNAGDLIRCEMHRESSGIDNGGLIAHTSSSLGWGVSPSASLRVFKFG